MTLGFGIRFNIQQDIDCISAGMTFHIKYKIVASNADYFGVELRTPTQMMPYPWWDQTQGVWHEVEEVIPEDFTDSPLNIRIGFQKLFGIWPTFECYVDDIYIY